VTEQRGHSAFSFNSSVLVKELKEKAECPQTIVFTNGCFDLLHVGHLRLLERAAEMGDLLVVGLNSDASVRRLKGPGRPILPFEERAELLAGLKAVDQVVGFDEETPLKLIEQIEPDVLVKGGDWPKQQIVGREVVERRGGRVVTLPLSDDWSTSRIIDRIRSGGTGP
jgi:D-beta-D-heptose 7-phosphate kinase/D-beta-D-heptose 1-phosphate adenosyltransferase